MMPSERILNIVSMALSLQKSMLSAISDERWGDIQELDRDLRACFTNVDHSALSEEDAELLAQGMQGALAFYEELNNFVIEQRDVTAQQLAELRAKKEGVITYEEVGKRTRSR